MTTTNRALSVRYPRNPPGDDGAASMWHRLGSNPPVYDYEPRPRGAMAQGTAMARRCLGYGGLARITRPPPRTIGGKWKFAPWIIAYLPAHRVYCESFGGAASVLLLRKPCAYAEVYKRPKRRC